MKKYGYKGKNGVIFINTKDYDISNNKMITEMAEVITEKKERERTAKKQSNVSAEEIEKRGTDRKEQLEERKRTREETKSEYQISFETSSADDNIILIKENKNVNYKQALIILDGKEISSSELDKINLRGISSVISFSGNENNIKKYGEKAKNGVIIIETNKNSKPTVDTDNLTDFKLNDGESFTISKRSSDEDLDFYKQTLQKSDCKVRFSNIKRNNKKEITSITIVLEKNGTESKKKINQTNAIDPIQIGVSNNKPFIK